jgi:hypothetical protein
VNGGAALQERTVTADVPEPEFEKHQSHHKWDGPTYPADRIIREAQRAWTELQASPEWQHWIVIGKAMQIGRAAAMREANTNQAVGRSYNAAFSRWLDQVGLSRIDKSDRAKLFHVMDHLGQIETWRSALTTTQRLQLNHPTTVLRKWRAATVIPQSSDTRVSPIAKIKSSLAETIEENHRLKREIELGGGDLWTAQDRPDDIAKVMVGKLSRAKAEKVARAILRHLKEAAPQ